MYILGTIYIIYIIYIYIYIVLLLVHSCTEHIMIDFVVESKLIVYDVASLEVKRPRIL